MKSQIALWAFVLTVLFLSPFSLKAETPRDSANISGKLWNFRGIGSAHLAAKKCGTQNLPDAEELKDAIADGLLPQIPRAASIVAFWTSDDGENDKESTVVDAKGYELSEPNDSRAGIGIFCVDRNPKNQAAGNGVHVNINNNPTFNNGGGSSPSGTTAQQPLRISQNPAPSNAGMTKEQMLENIRGNIRVLKNSLNMNIEPYLKDMMRKTIANYESYERQLLAGTPVDQLKPLHTGEELDRISQKGQREQQERFDAQNKSVEKTLKEADQVLKGLNAPRPAPRIPSYPVGGKSRFDDGSIAEPKTNPYLDPKNRNPDGTINMEKDQKDLDRHYAPYMKSKYKYSGDATHAPFVTYPGKHEYYPAK